MAFYLSPQKIPVLADYKIHERNAILTIAANKLSAPEKFVINILKLALLIPAFLWMATLNSWLIILPIMILFCSYYFIMRPVSLWFIYKHLNSAIKQYQAKKK